MSTAKELAGENLTQRDKPDSGIGSSWKTGMVMLLGSLFVTLLVLEVGIRSYDSYRGNSIGFFSSFRNIVARSVGSQIPFRSFGFEPYAVVDGVRFISSQHEELYPIEKLEGTYRIVAFGGSTTANNVAVRNGGPHYPLQLQSDLRERLGRDDVEVINVGNSSYATPHSLILMELDVLSWDADLFIISHNANDRSPAYWPDFTFDYSNKYSDPYYAGEDLKTRFTTANVIFQHSELYWLVKSKLNGLINKDAFSVKRKSYGSEPNPAALLVFERNLRSFASLAKANGIDVLFATQAFNPGGVTLNEKPYNDYVLWPEDSEIEFHQARYNEAIHKVAMETNSLFVDNARLLDNKPEYFIDALHYTDSGVRALARNFADLLIANEVVK